MGGKLEGDVPSLADVLLGDRDRPESHPLLLERRVFFEPIRSYLSVPEHGIVLGDWMYVENSDLGRFLYLTVPPYLATLPPVPNRKKALAERLRVLLLEHPRVEIDVDDLPEDRANALRGLGYGR